MKVKQSSHGRILAFDFIKAFCAFGIICYHFAIHSRKLGWLVEVPNHTVGWGDIFVVIFFVVSGALLYLHHSEIPSIADFYKKRCVAIFPAFYLAYLSVVVLRKILSPQNFLFQRPLKYYAITIVGMDGFLWTSTRPHNYYILGEWFLGAILLAYLLYPLLVWLLQKNEKIYILSVFGMFMLTYNWEMLAQSPLRNIFSICFSFSIGMMIAKHSLYQDKSLYILGAIVFAFFAGLPLKPHFVLSGQFGGIALFFFLFAIGNKIQRIKWLREAISWIGSVSYEMFLFQHIVILYVLKAMMPANNVFALGLLFITTLLTIGVASLLHLVIKMGKRHIVKNRISN